MKKYEDVLIWIVVISLFLFVPRTAALLAAFAVGVFLLFIVGLILSLLYELVWGSKHTRKLAQFKKRSEGKYFLWYSSNKRLKAVIDQDLKPLLGIEFELVYNNREAVETTLTEQEWRYLLTKTNTIKFPRLITIRNGEVKAVSFYKEVHAHRFLEMGKEDYKKNVLLKLEKFKHE